MENDHGRAVVQQESVVYKALTWTNGGSWDEAIHVGYVSSAVWETGVNLTKRTLCVRACLCVNYVNC